MSTAVQVLTPEIGVVVEKTGIAGHPRGLTTLFFTEFWERFSYYGMRALLVLYMTASVADGGLAFSPGKATQIYGLYTSSVYVTAILGGIIADNLLGARRSVLFGGIIIALGHFAMAFHAMSFFYGGMVLIVIGTGLLKPNISTMVGKLYAENDARRDSGFSIFYMGINLGAMIAPLVCGTLGQRINWHLGFAAAGVGMTFGLIQYTLHRERLLHVGERPEKKNSTSNQGPHHPALSSDDVKRLCVIFLLFVFSSVFWAAFEQAGSSLTLFAQNLTRNNLFGWEFPSSWFQSVNSTFILILAPVFSWLWLKMGTRQPSSPIKFSFGLMFVGLGYVFLVLGTFFINDGKIGPLWLVGLYLIHTIGELCLSPVGLSTVTKVAPARFVGLLMGMWFVFIAIGNYGAASIAGLFDHTAGWTSVRFFFLAIAIGTFAAAGLLASMNPFIRKLLGKPM